MEVDESKVCLNDLFDLSEFVKPGCTVYLPQKMLPRFRRIYEKYEQAKVDSSSATDLLKVLLQREQEAKQKVKTEARREGIELIYNNKEKTQGNFAFNLKKLGGWWTVIGAAAVTGISFLIKTLIKAHADAVEARKNQEKIVRKRKEVEAKEAAYVQAFLEQETMVTNDINYSRKDFSLMDESYIYMLRAFVCNPIVQKALRVLGAKVTGVIIKDNLNKTLEELEALTERKESSLGDGGDD